MTSYDPAASEALRLKLLREAEAAGLTHVVQYLTQDASHFLKAGRMAAEEEIPEQSIFSYTMQ